VDRPGGEVVSTRPRDREAQVRAETGDVGFNGFVAEGVGDRLFVQALLEVQDEALGLVVFGLVPDGARNGDADAVLA
jgi:hypothetical protein